jgi:hypothetical protein
MIASVMVPTAPIARPCSASAGGKNPMRSTSPFQAKPIAKMQHPEDRLAQRAAAPPAVEAPGVEQRRGERDHTRGAQEAQKVGEQHQHEGTDREPVAPGEGPEGLRFAAGRKSVAGERGHDTPADQRDQQRKQIEGDPQRDGSEAGEHVERIQMNAEIRQQKHPEQRQKDPITRGRRVQGGCDRDGERWEEREVDGRGKRRENAARGAREAPCEPDQREHGEPDATDRWPPAPARGRRQQKAGQHRRGIAEQHLVAMPEGGRK